MIAFRNADARYPFLWEDSSQPAARWHGQGDGPVHYFSDTPNGAWAEFLRHEDIADPDDLAGIRRAMWAVEVGDKPAVAPALDDDILLGGVASYPDCRRAATALRAVGHAGLTAQSAALLPGGASGYRVVGALVDAPPREGETIVLFGPRPDLVGWLAANDARPAAWLLERVRPLS